jgi:RsiW-degrading membrane proteinase PrsW (M82 family)
MSSSTEPVSTRKLHLRWLAVLLTGLALFGAVLAVLIGTGDPLYLPCLLLLGAGVVPVTFATLVSEIEPSHTLSLERLLVGAVLGGVVGAVLAGLLEFETAHALGSLPTTLVGLIEESAKLVIPMLLFGWRRPVARAVDGLVLGVAVGSGFAAVETMGYAFVTLLRAGGHLEPVAQLLVLRAVGSLGGHAAWTGLACAALFGARSARNRMLGRARFLCVFVGMVALHADWDRSANGSGYLTVGGISFILLMAVAWWLHAHPPGRSRRRADVGMDRGVTVLAAR